MSALKKIFHRLHRDERGTAAVTFILCLPLFMTVVSLIVQFALILNAKMMVTDAAIAAGRSAVTSLPEEQNENIRKAALFMLAASSPKGNGGSQEGQDIDAALRTLGVKPPRDFALRYAFADNATTVDYALGDYKHSVGRELEITVTYKFHLDIPIARAILGRNVESIGGVTGRYFQLKSSVKVQLAHGRGTESDSQTGEPLEPAN